MTGRPIRVALSALAIWAVLFAPGAVADDAGAGSGPVNPDRVAAAIVAPTFGSDGIVMARSCRDDGPVRQDCALGADDALASASSDDELQVSRVGTHGQLGGDDIEIRQSAPMRAPPRG